MNCYHIEGGYPISGTIRASGNKNAALPCIAAALLTDEPVILRNIPDIEDVQVMLAAYRALGGEVSSIGPNAWRLKTGNIVSSEIPPEHAHKIALGCNRRYQSADLKRTRRTRQCYYTR